MNYSKASLKTASYLAHELELNEEKEEILAYALENLILSVFGFIIVIVVGFWLKVTFPALVAFVFGGILRKLSGGAHFNSPTKCLITGAIVYGLLGAIAVQITQVGLVNFSNTFYLIPLFISLLLVVIYAPVDSKAKPIKSLIFRRKLKFLASLFVVLAAIFVMLTNTEQFQMAIVLGVFFQSLTLLPVLK